jgi:hypothetical protein
MDQKEAAIDQIECVIGKPRSARVRLPQGHIGQAGLLTSVPGLFKLAFVRIDSTNIPPQPHHFSKHARHRTDAATEVGGLHSGLQSCAQ